MLASVICAAILWASPLLVASLGDAPAAGQPPPAEAVAPGVTSISVLPGGPAGPGLFQDLRLRLPGVAIGAQQSRADPSTPLELTVFVALRDAADGTAWQLELITSDGRGFDRVLHMESAWSEPERTRFAAANIAQLIEGVEAGTAEPDREQVALPVAPIAVTSRGAPEIIVIPGVVDAPRDDPPAVVPAAAPAPASPAPQRRWMLGLRAAPAAVIGLGEPDDRSRFAGAGGLVGVTARSPRGVLVLTEVRGLRAASAVLDASLGRARVSLGSGFAVRSARGGGELEVQGALSVEPWWIRRGGQSVSVPGRAPALGGWGRVVAGALWRWDRTELRVGGWMELAGSGVPNDDGLQVAGISLEEDVDGVATGTPAFRVGGAELSAGLELQVGFGVGPAGE